MLAARRAATGKLKKLPLDTLARSVGRTWATRKAKFVQLVRPAFNLPLTNKEWGKVGEGGGDEKWKARIA